MPQLPVGANPSLLSNFKPAELERWMDGLPIPSRGPHTTASPTKFGCTINQDFEIPWARATLRKGMQGHLLNERSTEQGMQSLIYIRGITESWNKGNWLSNSWVPSKIVNKGAAWKENLKDWTIKLESPRMIVNVTTPATIIDTTILGKTVTKLLATFYATPAPFIGTKFQDILDKRGCSIDDIVQIILRGMRNANIYGRMNTSNFTITDLIADANHTIDSNYPHGTGGVYLRYHVSSSTVAYWKPNAAYVYVGKSVDFRERFGGHLKSTSKYGDLTRGSQRLVMIALCIMDERDNNDFAFLVEQVFVCLFETYRSHLIIDPSSIVRSDSPIEFVESVKAVYYCRTASIKVFQETGFPGAASRTGFGAPNGGNWSMPLAEWNVMSDQILFVRHDTYVKNRANGAIMPMAVFKTAKPKIARYHKHADRHGRLMNRMTPFLKQHKGKYFFGIEFTDKTGDGTSAPMQDADYYVVFEVRKDGMPHPQAWSRQATIGGYLNWDQGRSMAVRLEWEHPPRSGLWRYTYVQTTKIYKFISPDIMGSSKNMARAISLIQWLFNARPNHTLDWIAHLRGCAYVVQAFYDYHNRRILIKDQTPIAMKSGGLRTIDNIVAQMGQVGLFNSNGEFGMFPDAPDAYSASKRKSCDTCVIMSTRNVGETLKLECKPVKHLPGCCVVCFMFGRPCCSWTAASYIRASRQFTTAFAADTTTRTKVTGDDIEKHWKVRAALIAQPLWKDTGIGQNFRQDTSNIMGLTEREDEVAEAPEEANDAEDSAGEEEDEL